MRINSGSSDIVEATTSHYHGVNASTSLQDTREVGRRSLRKVRHLRLPIVKLIMLRSLDSCANSVLFFCPSEIREVLVCAICSDRSHIYNFEF
jgi:hypothetical protein